MECQAGKAMIQEVKKAIERMDRLTACRDPRSFRRAGIKATLRGKSAQRNCKSFDFDPSDDQSFIPSCFEYGCCLAGGLQCVRICWRPLRPWRCSQLHHPRTPRPRDWTGLVSSNWFLGRQLGWAGFPG